MKINYKKIKEIIKNNIEWIIFFIVLIGFIAIAEDVFEQEIMRSDTIAYNIIVQNLRNDTLTKVMSFITNLGGVTVLVSIAVLSLLLIRKKKVSIAICLNLLLSSGLNAILKNIVQRPRPEGYRLINESGYSFPSGHSMISTAFYGLIIYFVYKYVKNKYIKYTLCALLTILIPFIAVSRVYLGVHYASDVIAGFLLSIAYLIGFVKVYNSMKIGENNE